MLADESLDFFRQIYLYFYVVGVTHLGSELVRCPAERKKAIDR